MRFIEQFYKLIAPYDCLGCGQEGTLACFECREAALSDSQARCYRCNRLSHRSKTCASCRRKSAVRYLWMRTEYEGLAKQLVHVMKFRYSAEAAAIIGSELHSILPHLPAGTVVVPVPTVSAHVRQRGLDHTTLIAEAIAREKGLRVQKILRRTGVARQVGATRNTRHKQMETAFRVVSGPHDVRLPVLLVDDVFTTGATIEGAARTLRDAGYETIDAVIFAKTK